MVNLLIQCLIWNKNKYGFNFTETIVLGIITMYVKNQDYGLFMLLERREKNESFEKRHS